jgi:hypothetical protein
MSPNLTRNDGQAFAGLVHSRLSGAELASAGTPPSTPVESLLQALQALKPNEFAELLARSTPRTPAEASSHVD